MDFEIVLQNLLREYHMNVTELTRQSTLHPSYVYKLLKGEHSPSLHTLELIAEVFGLSVSTLIQLTEQDI